jgi:pimeloyl-ACP methyl ester carboxylesterase
MLTLVRDRGPKAVAEEMIPKLLGESTRGGSPGIAPKVDELIVSNAGAAIAGAITALMTRPDSIPLLGSIHCPVLIVVGEEDTVTPPPLSRGMHEAIAGSEFVTIPRAGHLASLEQPDAFNAALARFLTHRV